MQSIASVSRGKVSKPQKPRPDFPLFPHASGRWAKKIRGKFHYFGKWADDPKGEKALALWSDQKDDLLAGRTPRRANGELTVQAACDQFLHAKKQAVGFGDLSQRTWDGYFRTCLAIADTLGRKTPVSVLTTDDFGRLREALATKQDGKHAAAATLTLEIRKARVLFSWLHKAELIENPIRYGLSFQPPSKRAMELARQESGERFFEPGEVLWMLGRANPAMKAMIFLGANAAYGPTDCAHLEFRHLDLEKGWAFMPRRKTAEKRRAKLWPETVKAIRDYLKRRREPKDKADRDRVFLTRQGFAFLLASGKSTITARFRDSLLVKSDFYRPGHAFYSLRRTFRTVADETGDWPAINFVMGHADSTMGGVYRQRIGDDRLERVAEHVRTWLHGAPAGSSAAKGGAQ